MRPQATTEGVGADRVRPGRHAILSALLAESVQSVTIAGRRPRLLDCGGGTGASAVPLAVAGGEVTVLDISADALATLERRADEAGVGDRVHAVQGDAEAMLGLVDPGSYDLVLAHGILESVDDVALTMAGIAAAVRPEGVVSLLVGNPVATVLARALAGDPAGALRELRLLSALDSPPRLDPDAVERYCTGAGLLVESRHGIGVFSDLLPGSTLDSPGARDLVAELDAEAASRSPFADLAARVHLRAVRPAAA